MNLANVDLNLMTALEALLQEQQVSRAAYRIGRSQPAVSNALGRLRDLFGDPLFVRTPQGMMPTPRATEIRPLIEMALEQLRAALDDKRFEPQTSNRHFVIATADASAIHYLPRIMPALRSQAPGVTIAVVEAWGSEAVEAIARGKVDLALGVFSQQQEHFVSEPLSALREVCVGDRDNPALRGKSLTLERFLVLPKIVLERRESGNVINATLASAGHKSNIALSLPQFLGAARIVVGTDLVMALPDALMDVLPDRHLYAVVPFAVDVPDVLVRMIWNRRFEADAAHVWFRNLIKQCLVPEI
ncbi:LysR family transcriptional regulator [Aquisediminimonas profunda]|uniref:LysR family transcriptional regulator n=1 Tax=Aquisediminimonas profunda TaxID=1550733 RepID=UPI001C628C64|nr:LysR family transcriptional regulator [Aquisediminimonas profunda]